MSFFLLLLLMIITITAAASSYCNTQPNTPPLYQKCLPLPTQEATFSWTYHPHNSTLSAAFSSSFISPSGWVGFGLNPSSPQMTYTRALLAFPDPTSGSLLLLPFLLTPTIKLQSSPLLSTPFTNPKLISSSATLLHSSSSSSSSSQQIHASSHVTIHATLTLNPNQTKINLVWNRGLYVQAYSPTIHPTTQSDLNSRATIDLLSSAATIKPSLPDTLRPLHATLNSLSWGFLLPLGVVVARYLRQWPDAGPSWFYAHAIVQVPGFLIGAVGFGMGIVMGGASIGVVYGIHRGLGIAAVVMGGLQVVAVVMRPGTTSRYRRYWKSYHHLVGYGCVVVGVVNVFEGMEVMGLGRSWAKLGYCLVVATLVGGCVAMEANAWVVVCRRAEEEKVMMRRGEAKGSGSITSL